MRSEEERRANDVDRFVRAFRAAVAGCGHILPTEAHPWVECPARAGWWWRANLCACHLGWTVDDEPLEIELRDGFPVGADGVSISPEIETLWRFACERPAPPQSVRDARPDMSENA